MKNYLIMFMILPREPYDFLYIDLHKKKEHPSMFRRKLDEFIITEELK